MTRKYGTWMLFMLLALPVCFGQGQKDQKKKPEAYSAIATATGGVAGGEMLPFNFAIDEYTSDTDLMKFAAMLKERGPDALLNALEKENKGRIYPDTGTGNDIAIARKRKDGANTVVTIVTARLMPFLERYRSGRSKDYPYGFLQVTLNEAGKGTGSILVAASIKFNKKADHYEIESYGNQYIKVVNVRLQK